jgi:hypothetical protein
VGARAWHRRPSCPRPNTPRRRPAPLSASGPPRPPAPPEPPGRSPTTNTGPRAASVAERSSCVPAALATAATTCEPLADPLLRVPPDCVPSARTHSAAPRAGRGGIPETRTRPWAAGRTVRPRAGPRAGPGPRGREEIWPPGRAMADAEAAIAIGAANVGFLGPGGAPSGRGRGPATRASTPRPRSRARASREGWAAGIGDAGALGLPFPGPGDSEGLGSGG